MSGVDKLTLAVARKYTDQTVIGGGAIKGKNCTIKSITDITGGHRLTFEWTLDDESTLTGTMDVMNGEPGPTGDDGVGIVGIEKTSASGLEDTYTITYTNGDTDTLIVTNGAQGPKGEDGADGRSFSIKAQYATYEALVEAHPTGSEGDAYFVGDDVQPDLYVWLSESSQWYNNGPLSGLKGDDGRGITSVTKTGTSELVDTYTITYTDGTSSLFTITNGEDGTQVEVEALVLTGTKIATITIDGADIDLYAPSGGGGDASLSTDVKSNLAVGAIASGTTLAQGTSFTEFVQKLLISEIAPTIGFSLSKSGNVVYGSSYTETLTVNVSNMGTAKKIKTIAWYQGNTLLDTTTVDSTTTGSWTYTMSTATTDTTTFKAIVTYTKSSDDDTSVTKTSSINFYYNKFYGAVASLTPDEATVEALTTALATGRGGTYSFTTTAARICYAYPKSLGALTSIKDGNGFSLFDSFTRTEQTYTQNGTSVVYYRYVLTDPTTVAGYSVIFA